METKNEDTCLKIRSTRATVAAGLRLYMGNFRRIFRATWLPALLLALASALSYQMMISTTSRLQNSMAQMAQGHMSGDWMSQYLMQSGVSLLSFLVMLLFKWLSGMQEAGNINVFKSAVGCEGKVYLAIPGERSGSGKVQITINDAVREYEAVTDGPALATGTSVRVVEVISADTMLVEPIESIII